MGVVRRSVTFDRASFFLFFQRNAAAGLFSRQNRFLKAGLPSLQEGQIWRGGYHVMLLYECRFASCNEITMSSWYFKRWWKSRYVTGNIFGTKNISEGIESSEIMGNQSFRNDTAQCLSRLCPGYERPVLQTVAPVYSDDQVKVLRYLYVFCSKGKGEGFCVYK